MAIVLMPGVLIVSNGAHPALFVLPNSDIGGNLWRLTLVRVLRTMRQRLSVRKRCSVLGVVAL
jgi:hypothetical protein